MGIPDPTSRRDYQQEIVQGANIIDKSLDFYQTSTFPQQKKMYDRAIKEALGGIQDAASALVNQHLVDLKEKLSQDYESYKKNPSPDNLSKVKDDIERLKEEA